MEQREVKELSNEEYMRYSRQLIMGSIGIEGQKKLKNAKVLIIGAGGLGSPASFYLSGAGVGTIGLVDGDIVDESNLHRQIIHTEDRVGINKTLSAKQQIAMFNRHIDVVTYQTHLTPENAREIVQDWDIVMDGSDNAKARYLINDICMILKKPLVSGSALQMEGQITVYGYNGGPCYRCMFPVPPPAHTVTNCADGGVLGVVPGIIGNLEALEIIKIILGFKDEQILTKRMIFFDAASMRFRNVKLRDRNPRCQVCGDEPSITDPSLIDYDDFCQTKCNKYALIQIPSENNITVEEFQKEYERLKEQADDIALVDVRGKIQYDIVSLPGSLNLPLKKMMEDPESIKKLTQEKKTVFIMCRRGNASKEATEFILKNLDIHNVKNVQGGIQEYITKIDPSLPIY
ncbi:molybdenum cofactor synthesis protein 3 [Stylonychia lemnae]|uniref:Adenylyltransferase and sulfurtransferase MOCS3 homolog n=1 Tax=Stylonychia lemnae TaxID=5949 RepID=A0A077ZZ82_STYLE|nr:molybdenum cofactor synthesis protein 3 [Stylonychia lemnae]|eukprot:CDW73808.1 molybdenum cofactor synthesis protein 3 [Stylonychia lemnae]